MAVAYIGMGGNLGDPVALMQTAARQLAAHPAVTLVELSPFYRSAPVGYVDQPDFINAVARLDVMLLPHEVLDLLQQLEREAGRERLFQNAPRTLDLDLLLYDELCLQDERLTVPHPRMHQRAFVLRPLLDLAPTLHLPGLGSAQAALQQCADQVVLPWSPEHEVVRKD
ncbi:2-amino-4-hydroxy-6-hydroxymethyldihydropteridine diphosphokinase [Leeia sp.]|uniref:2-amino-4-hydroxy-6- hydroxymethyldihydropteridine diphosphokinase n=1 Tax=Leeia sp. TaxID=2884678 RepID=UPI0035AE457E